MTSSAASARERRRAHLRRVRLRAARGAAGLVLASTVLVAAVGRIPSSSASTQPSADTKSSSSSAASESTSRADWGEDDAPVNDVSSGAS